MMNEHELKNIWNSPANHPEPSAIAEQAHQFLRHLRRRRWGFLAIMALSGSWLLVILAALASFVAKNGWASLRHDWAVLPLLMLPLAVLIFFLAQYRRHCRANPDPERSTLTSLRVLLDENRLARQRMKIIAALHAAVMLMIPLVVHQLRAGGKAGDEILIPAFVLLPLLMAAILGALAWRHQRYLLPRHRELTALLSAYG